MKDGKEVLEFDEDLQIPIKINDIGFTAMLDSGAGLDGISIKTFQKLTKKNPSLKLNPVNKLARGVNGSQIKAIGSIELCVTWGDANIDNLFWVMAITRDVLIVRPFLRSNKAILDLDTNTITINEITINMIQWHDHSSHRRRHTNYFFRAREK